MPYKLASLPQFDAFTSPNEREDRRYVLARTAFLEQLVKDPKIQAVFARWDKRANLNKLAANVASASDRLAKALGLAGTRLSLHSLRHTFASRLVMAGVDTCTVQQLGDGRI